MLVKAIRVGVADAGVGVAHTKFMSVKMLEIKKRIFNTYIFLICKKWPLVKLFFFQIKNEITSSIACKYIGYSVFAYVKRLS